MEPVEYTGRVFCPTVTTGLFVARRKGEAFITGNSGFPKGKNLGKEADKRDLQPHSLAGAFGGFQPKPCIEPVIVVMKPLDEKTYLAQALDNGKGCTWIDDCRVPIVSSADADEVSKKNQHTDFGSGPRTHNVYGDITKADRDNYNASLGRFPANVLVSDDALDDGIVRKSGKMRGNYHGFNDGNIYGKAGKAERDYAGDVGSFSRFFDLDAWFVDRIGELPEDVQKVFPNLLVPQASVSEKNAGLEGMPEKAKPEMGEFKDNPGRTTPKASAAPRANHHPTCKPVKLMSYLVTLGSRKGDVVLDPYTGSGTTGAAAVALKRSFFGCELDPEYVEIAKRRIVYAKKNGLAQPKVVKTKKSPKKKPRKGLWDGLE